MPFDKTLYPNTNLAIHAIFGGILGFFTSIVFLILYYGTTYDTYVSDAMRLRGAFWATVIIVFVIVLIFFHKQMFKYLNDTLGNDEAIDEE
jgi:hypothetical protein